MEFNVVFHERRNEKIGVIVSLLKAIFDFQLVVFKSSSDKLLGQKLSFDQKIIDGALVDEYLQFWSAVLFLI